MKVEAIMSKPVITVAPETPIKTAARLLVACGISAVPVVDARGTLVGIVSEADLLPVDPNAASAARTVAELMTSPVITVPSDADGSMAARIMIDANVKRLPVVDDDKLVGIVSRRDLVRVIARADEDLQLELDRRLRELPIGLQDGAVRVEAGVATIGLGAGSGRRLAESVALSVPGILEVRFSAPNR